MAGTLRVRPFEASVPIRRVRAASIAALVVSCIAAFTCPEAQASDAARAPGAALDEGAMSARLLTLVNQARAESRRCGDTVFRPAKPLLWNEALARAAREHSEDMARHNYYDHVSLDGSTPAQRLKRTGYVYRDRAENIAAGRMTPEEAIAGWVKSPEHCSVLMDPAFTEMGVAVATNVNSQHGAYWTQVFGTPRAVRNASAVSPSRV